MKSMKAVRQFSLTNFVTTYRHPIGITLVLVVAAFMRFYQLHSLPPGLHPDEAANGLDVLTIVQHHNFQPFYPANGGREGLFFIIQALFVWILGNTTYALRVAPALIGTLGCGAVYLWGSSWFGKRAGLLAALIMATLPWSVIISRDGFRADMVQLVVPLTLWLYTKAFRSTNAKSPRAALWYIAAGVSFGAGFYTYIAFRLLPAAMVAGLIYMAIWRKEQLRKWRRGMAVSAVTALVVLIPMGIYGVHHPADLLSRAGGVSVTNPALNHGHLLETFGANIVNTALMFNFSGDQNYRQNLGGSPELNIFIGVMFLVGILLSLRRWRSLRYTGVLLVFGAMLLPELLTAEGIPHALRSIGAMPEAVMLAAIGIGYMLDTWRGMFPLNSVARNSGTVAVIVLLALSAYQGYVEYFVAWANAPGTYAAYSEDTTDLANYYINTPFAGRRYAIGGGYGLMPLQYLAHDHAPYIQVDPNNLAKLVVPPHIALQFSMEEGDKATALKTLKTRFPKGQISPHYSAFSGNELFVIYTVPAS